MYVNKRGKIVEFFIYNLKLQIKCVDLKLTIKICTILRHS